VGRDVGRSLAEVRKSGGADLGSSNVGEEVAERGAQRCNECGECVGKMTNDFREERAFGMDQGMTER
jgi:hypothetical protein